MTVPIILKMPERQYNAVWSARRIDQSIQSVILETIDRRFGITPIPEKPFLERVEVIFHD